MSKLFIECEKAQHVCDKSQYHEASFFERIKLAVHLLYCNACRKYSKKNAKLTQCIEQSEISLLEDSVKKDLNVKFKKELSKHTD